ncbi:MAG: cyclic nucleotide-binding domain-containing protein [Candidatus Promineifilaceae bacterium]
MTKRLQSAFDILPGEGRMVAIVLAYAIALYFSNVMARTASTALFFGQYDAETLPYTSLFLMVVGPLVSVIYLRLNNRFALSKVLLGIHVFLLISLIILPLVLSRTSAPYLLFALPIYFGVNNSLTISSFWNLLGRIYNLRQGKRLFPLLSSGEHMATIVAGFAAPLLVARIGTANLYWIGALFMVFTILLLIVINRDNAGKLEVEAGGEENPGKIRSGIGDLLQESYVRLIFALFALFIVGIYMVGNIAYQQAELRFPTADAMAGYIGVFMGIFGVLSLIVQWFIAGRVLDRYGVRSMIMATPAGLFFFMALFALVGTFANWPAALFWLAASAAMYQAILDAVDSASVNIMYQPLPASLRTQAQTTVIGIIYPLAIGLSGLLLIGLIDGLGFDSVQLSYATLVVIAIWLSVALRLGRAYPQRLREALQQRKLGSLGMARPDRSSLPVFQEALQSTHPAIVLYALTTLEELAPETVPEQLPALLAYPDDQVRKAALQHMAMTAPSQTPPGVLQLLKPQNDAEVRAAALDAWYAISPAEATASLSSYAADAHPAVKREALSILCRHADADERRQGFELVSALAASTDPGERLVAAQVIPTVPVPDLTPQLLALLEDADPAVRRAALKAAAQTHIPTTWPLAISALANEETQAQAVTALVAGGEAVLPFLATACSGPDVDPRVLSGVATVCGRIGGEEAVALLLDQLHNADAGVRRAALLALSRCAFIAPPEKRRLIEEQLQQEAARAAQTVAAQVDVGDEPQVRLLAGALEQTRQQQADNLLLLLSFVIDTPTVLSAREALQPGRESSEEKQSYALEALDISIDHDYKALLLPFFQDETPVERLSHLDKRVAQELAGREQRILALLQNNNGETSRWTAVCAIYALGLLGVEEAAETITETAARHSDDVLLTETALESLEALGVSLDDIVRKHPNLQTAVSSYQARGEGELSTVRKSDALQKVSIFSHLPNNILPTISALTVDIKKQAGETVIHEGDEGDFLYIVVDGQLNVHVSDHVFATIGPGGVAGEIALLDSEPRTASITTSTKSHLLRLDQEPFYKLLAAQPQLARDLMSLLSRRLRERTQALASKKQDFAAQPVLPVVAVQPGATAVAVPGSLVDLQKLFVLKGVDLFGQSNDELLGQVALLLDEVDLAGGQTLFQKGDPGRSLYIVAEGQVRVHDEDRTLAYLDEGEVFGEMALLDSEPRLASVTAVIPTQLLRLEQGPFFELLQAEPELARGIITMLSRRLRTRLEELSVQGEHGTAAR